MRTAEEQRIAAVKALNILNSPREPAFDAVVELLGAAFDCPNAVMAILNGDEFWFKASAGVHGLTAARKNSACSMVVDSAKPMIFPDFKSDPEFCNHPYFVERGFRFYAGCPIKDPAGTVIGTVCVFDTEPRPGAQELMPQLILIGKQASALVELHNRLLGRPAENAARPAASAGDTSRELCIDENLEKITAKLPDGLCVISGEKLVFCNPFLEQLLGYDPGELLNLSPSSLLHPDDRQRCGESIASLIAGGPEVHTAYRMRTKSGSTVPVEIYSRLVELDGVPSVVSVIRDIQERQNLEQERTSLESKLQQVQKLESLGILAGGIAHDFNNLLTGVLGNSSLALNELSDNHAAYRQVKNIQEAATRATELCRKMLTYSGRGQYVLQSVSLGDLVQDIAHLLKTSISKKTELILDFEENTPPIEGDPAQLGQVIMNLITNANDALDGEPGKIHITTGRTLATREYFASQTFLDDNLDEGEYVYVQVEDTGHGMDADTAQRVFDPFFTTKFSGRGLGMAAALGIVRGHGGAIEVQSTPHEGTRIRVLFPFSSSQPAFVTPTSINGSDRAVLVVDDEPVVRDLVDAILSKEGYDVLSAVCGIQGMEMFKEHQNQIQLVVLDLTMPRKDGRQMLHEIRELSPEVPVLLSSGYHKDEGGKLPKNDPNLAFLPKPYTAEQLIASCRGLRLNSA